MMLKQRQSGFNRVNHSKSCHKGINRFPERTKVYKSRPRRDPCPNPEQLNESGDIIFHYSFHNRRARQPKQVRRAAANSMSNVATAQKSNGKAATEEKAVMEDVKTEQQQVKPAENTVLSLEKRIEKVQELNIVIDKWRKLQEARKNLNEFKLGNDGMNSTIIIRDAAGREFKTSQSIVFTTVLQTVQQVLDEKIAETEVQINFAS